MTKQELRKKAMKLPLSPGVYIMKDGQGKIIYIGKAKALKNRVSQYFGSDTNHEDKVIQMVENASDFEYIVTDSEFEALVLECSLIKQYKPKYNILLKDDKGFHYISLSEDEFPRIRIARKKEQDGKVYFGPYTSSYAVQQAVDSANKAFRLSVCNRVLGKGKVQKPCLNYHIGQCMAPCKGHMSPQEYSEIVTQAMDFIKGGQDNTIRSLTQKMEAHAENLEFEQAARLRDRIKWVKNINSRQKVVMSRIPEQDVIALCSSEGKCCFEVFRFRDGRLCDSEHHILEAIADLPALRTDFITSYYEMRDRIPPHVLVDGPLDDKDLLAEFLRKKRKGRFAFAEPQKGESAHLVALCRKNAEEHLLHLLGRKDKKKAVLEELGQMLGLSAPPLYIESYDISHFAGDNTVCGMVVFADGRPLRKAYKRFAVKTTDGGDDYGAMSEIIERRFGRYFEQKDSGEGFGRLPDLILLDGGQNHVAVIGRILDRLSLEVPLYGMVKDDKHKTRAIASLQGEIALSKNRSAYTFVSEIQEEVHRFAITYQKSKHKSKSFHSVLTDIEGVGEGRAKALLKHFKTMKAIKEATAEELCALPGLPKTTAENIYNFFRKD